MNFSNRFFKMFNPTNLDFCSETPLGSFENSDFFAESFSVIIAQISPFIQGFYWVFEFSNFLRKCSRDSPRCSSKDFSNSSFRYCAGLHLFNFSQDYFINSCKKYCRIDFLAFFNEFFKKFFYE